MHLLETGLARLHAVTECCRGLQDVRTTPEERGVPETTWLVAEELGYGSVGEHARGDLPECTEGRQRAQGPGDGECVQPGPLGQFRRRERTGIEVIRHAALDERSEHWCQVEMGE